MENKRLSQALNSYGRSVDYRDLRICRRCYELRGSWRYSGESCLFNELCSCMATARQEQPKWAGFDFNSVAELCRCCLAELLPSGSRWSVWFCVECKNMVTAFNEEASQCVIPIGRHSLMNGVALRGGKRPNRSAVAQFILAYRGLCKGMNTLGSWSAFVLERRLSRLGLGHERDVFVGEYLQAITEPGIKKKRVFQQLLQYLHGEEPDVV